MVLSFSLRTTHSDHLKRIENEVGITGVPIIETTHYLVDSVNFGLE
jgi:hypothetical protein